MSETLKYFDLTISAPRRLALLRAAFDAHAARYPHCPESLKPKSWRDIRGTTFAGVAAYCCAGLHLVTSDDGASWYTHGGAQFRDEQFADECDSVRIDHTGWFTDVDRDEKARGIIARLTHGRFITGFHWSTNGERVYFPTVFDDERDAALMADEHARIFADHAREDSERAARAQSLQHYEEDALTRLRECLALRNNKCFARCRNEARYLVQQIRTLRDELCSDFADVL